MPEIWAEDFSILVEGNKENMVESTHTHTHTSRERERDRQSDRQKEREREREVLVFKCNRGKVRVKRYGIEK